MGALAARGGARRQGGARALIGPDRCPLCGAAATAFAVVGEHVYGGRPEQKFYECPSCDVAFLFPRLTEEEEARFYAQEFEKFMEDRAGHAAGWSGPEAHIAANQPHVRRRLAAMAADLARPRLKVLEVGCSSGFMLLALRERGTEVMGVDPSGAFTRFVRSRGIPVFDSLDQFEAQAGAAGSLDLVIHFFVFEHIRHPVVFLEQCLRLLAPGGVVFFEVPSRSDPLVTIYDVPAFHRFYWSVAHHWYFNARSLQYVCERLDCAFELVPEQRYDLSNHMWWALEGKPGGSGRYASRLTPELEAAYLESMRRTGHCDTFFVRLRKSDTPGSSRA